MKIKSKTTWQPEARQFFKQIASEYELTDDEQVILQAACQNLSVFWEASRQIDKEGLTTTNDTGMVRKHPCCEVGKNAWAGFLSGCRLLQIGSPADMKHRPGRPDGGYRGANS